MKLIIVIILIILCVVAINLILKKRSTGKIENQSNFREVVKKTFPKYTIIEKFGQVMICQIDHRNEPDELVFIRIGMPKKIRKEGRRVIAEYPKQPSSAELKRDLSKFLI
ncbi:hypothetical protein AhaeINNSZ174_06670 [Acinetobacter haemolyticus]|uniref:hypothetical protein n=1 Tax=Acinetobacter haemolyticus TaxID=29430 RepID=UPI001331DFD5|nr:hypothetical protein [Acinetobacter haemolyticus]QHI29166.1 hypothetical protein AhaeINNSZ174_06670 [Acinetobacter haemolyticus]